MTHNAAPVDRAACPVWISFTSVEASNRMSVTVPWTFVRHQAPNIVGMFGAGLRSALPRLGGGQVDTPSAPVTRRMGPFPPALIEAYADWAGAPPDRYDGVLPPHFFSYWGLGLVSELTGRAPYNLLSAVNQGCRIETRQLLPADDVLQVRGRLMDVSDDGRRVRIASQLAAGTRRAPQAQDIEVVAAVPRRHPGPRRADKSRAPAPAFDTVGHWSAEASDGLNFALLTGDFNPLHTLTPVGRRTRYRGCILHGFGILARTYEAIRNAGIRIAEFEIRYVKPVPLPSADLAVQVASESEADGRRAIRLIGVADTLHLAGHLNEKLPGTSA